MSEPSIGLLYDVVFTAWDDSVVREVAVEGVGMGEATILVETRLSRDSDRGCALVVPAGKYDLGDSVSKEDIDVSP